MTLKEATLIAIVSAAERIETEATRAWFSKYDPSNHYGCDTLCESIYADYEDLADAVLTGQVALADTRRSDRFISTAVKVCAETEGGIAYVKALIGAYRGESFPRFEDYVCLA